MGNFFHRTTTVIPETLVDISEILNEVQELERHFHSYEKWFGSTGGVAPGLQNSLTGYRLTSNAVANVFKHTNNNNSCNTI